MDEYEKCLEQLVDDLYLYAIEIGHVPYEYASSLQRAAELINHKLAIDLVKGWDE
jgi:hypothetical protein